MRVLHSRVNGNQKLHTFWRDVAVGTDVLAVMPSGRFGWDSGRYAPCVPPETRREAAGPADLALNILLSAIGHKLPCAESPLRGQDRRSGRMSPGNGSKPTMSKVTRGFKLRVKRLSKGKRKLCVPLQVGGLRTKFSNHPVCSKNGQVDVDNETITINAGFVTDYSSIPTVFSWFVSWSRVDVAGVVHDFLYRQPGFPRKKADDIWEEIAREGPHGATGFQAITCWLMLRSFGGLSIKPRRWRTIVVWETPVAVIWGLLILKLLDTLLHGLWELFVHCITAGSYFLLSLSHALRLAFW